MTKRRLLLLGIAVLVVVADQLTKWWAVERLDDGSVIEVVWTLQLALARNRGTAFSFGSGSGAGAWLAVGALVVVGAFLWRSQIVAKRWGAIAIGLILGGALGNIVDRAARGESGLMSGAVIDFVDLQWWPVFNLADAAICVGAGLLIVGLLFWSDGDRSASDVDDAADPRRQNEASEVSDKAAP